MSKLIGMTRNALSNGRFIWTLALFPLLFVAAMALCKLFPRLYYFTAREDGLAEWTTAIAYFIAAFVAGAIARHLWRRRESIYALLYLLLAAGFFLIAMEEISWGQRLLGFETPPNLQPINIQDEFNFHNLSRFPIHEAFIAVGFYGAFARMIATPLFGKTNPKFVKLLTAPFVLFLYFALPLAYYVHVEIIWYSELVPDGRQLMEWRDYWAENPSFINGQDQEPLELLLSLGFLAFVVINWTLLPIAAAAERVDDAARRFVASPVANLAAHRATRSRPRH